MGRRAGRFVLASRRVLRAAGWGFEGAARVWPALLGLLVTTLFLAVLATAPFLVAADEALAGYPWAADVLRTFDAIFLLEWQMDRPDVAGMVTLGLGLAVLVTLLQQTVFSAALLATLERPGDRPRLSEFLSRGLRGFWPMLRLLAGSLFLLWALTWAWDLTVEKVWTSWIEPGIVSRRAAFAWEVGRALGFAALYLLVRTGCDYGRVRMVVEGRRSAAVSLLYGFRFFATRFPGAICVAGIVVAAESAAVALLAFADRQIVPAGPGTLLAAFLLAQVLILARIAGRAVSLAAAHGYFRGIRDEWLAEKAIPRGDHPVPGPIPEPYEGAEWA